MTEWLKAAVAADGGDPAAFRAKFLAEARRLHALGASCEYIARRLRVPHDTMRDWMNGKTRML